MKEVKEEPPKVAVAPVFVTPATADEQPALPLGRPTGVTKMFGMVGNVKLKEKFVEDADALTMSKSTMYETELSPLAGPHASQ